MQTKTNKNQPSSRHYPKSIVRILTDATVESLQASEDGVFQSVSKAIDDVRKKVSHKGSGKELHDPSLAAPHHSDNASGGEPAS